jgi:hypothetical protein
MYDVALLPGRRITDGEGVTGRLFHTLAPVPLRTVAIRLQSVQGSNLKFPNSLSGQDVVSVCNRGSAPISLES